MFGCIFYILFHQRCTFVKLKQPIYVFICTLQTISENKLTFPLYNFATYPSLTSVLSLSVYLRSPLSIYPSIVGIREVYCMCL